MKATRLAYALLSLSLSTVDVISASSSIRPLDTTSRLGVLSKRTHNRTPAPWSRLRGGDHDEERYSRQVYTLGARAHGLIRSTTIYLDGPPTSGLMYECAKNLALSGVGSIVILANDDEVEARYHDADLDDLGKSYVRATRDELGHHPDDQVSYETILMEYVKRLNPAVDVSIRSRTELKDSRDAQRGVLVSIDRPQSTQIDLNNQCRDHDIAFVAIETAGVYGRTFCDFGPSFEVVDPDGETPLVVPLDHIDQLSDDTMLVHCIEGEKHDVSRGDQIKFLLSSGESLNPNCEILNIQSPRRFTVRCLSDGISVEDFVQNVNAQATSFTRVKIPHHLQFLPLNTAAQNANNDDSLFTPCDLDKSFDPIRRKALLSCFDTMQHFVLEHKRMPSKMDIEMFQASARSNVQDEMAREPKWNSIVESFARCCAGKLTPIQAIFGAIGAQEALKAASGLYTPIKQFLLYDCDELLIDFDVDSSSESGMNSGQSYILGKAVCDALASKRLFVVGAGAIGCELLKNLSAMGAGTGNGRIIVTDMDTIEKSNLSRQLLFRDADIGKFKSTAARDAVIRFNPEIHMDVHTSKVGDEEHGPFSDTFWSSDIDIVLNALDNVEARLYMDGQCIAHKKALVDAGTLGSKGNVQVVIPHQSESYGSSVDPPEAAIPVCTLKNFPYAIAHTIQWGRDLFDGFFERRPKQANDYVATLVTGFEHFPQKLVQDLGEDAALKAAIELKEDWSVVTKDKKTTIQELRKDSLRWAVTSALELFHDSIENILRQHPVDSVDDEGELFWSGTRRVPKALSYSDSDSSDSQQAVVNSNLVDYVRNAARLRVQTFLPLAEHVNHTTFTTEEAVMALRRWDDEYQPKSIQNENDDAVAYISSMLNGIIPDQACPLKSAEFEKDDDSNGHVAFVTAASNLRALCYGIAPVDAMETRRVAGRIVPAMISTTAFVSALSCIELLKLVQQAPLRTHRNAFINLALPFFAYTTPLPAYERPGIRGATYTLWDRILVKEGHKAASRGGITLRKFLKHVTKKAVSDPESTVVSSVSFGPYLIYANFLHEGDEEILQKSVWELLKEALAVGDDEFAGREEHRNVSHDPEQQLLSLKRRKFVDLSVTIEDQITGDEVELPPVRLEKRDVVKSQ